MNRMTALAREVFNKELYEPFDLTLTKPYDVSTTEELNPFVINGSPFQFTTSGLINKEERECPEILSGLLTGEYSFHCKKLLTLEEKEFLATHIRFTEGDVVAVELFREGRVEKTWLCFILSNGDKIDSGYLNSTTFLGLTPNKEYTLKELEL